MESRLVNAGFRFNKPKMYKLIHQLKKKALLCLLKPLIVGKPYRIWNYSPINAGADIIFGLFTKPLKFTYMYM